MSILRTHNLQNPDSSSINIVMDQGGNTNITGVTTVGGSNFHVPSGSVGIGTDNPISNLQVFGTNGIRITNSTNQNATTLLNFESNHPAFRMLNTSGNTTVKFKSDGDSFITSGNLGIGTDNPGTKLDVRGGNWSNGDIVVGQIGNAGRINFRRGADGSDSAFIGFAAADNNSRLSIGVDSGDGTIAFQTNSTERLRITSAGRMGVGTNDPAALLEVRDSENSTKGAAQIRISKGVGNGAAPTSVSRADSYLHIGGSEYSTSFGRYNIAFGYTNDEVGSGIPAYIGFVETSLSGYTLGDLVFGTRVNTSGSNTPTERLRITSNGMVRVTDSASLTFGNNDDMRIFHDGGSANYIDVYNKDLYIRCNRDAGITGGDIVLQPKSGENSAIFRDNGNVELYYDNTKRFETVSNGTKTTGRIFLNGTNGGFDYNNTAHTLEFLVANGSTHSELNSNAYVPSASGTRNLGASNKRWATLYVDKIAFGGAANTDQHSLDDYEEGTYTPTYQNFTTTGTSTLVGKYVKVGRQVTVGIKWSCTGTIAYGVSAFISLPFSMTYGDEHNGLIGMLHNSNSTSQTSGKSGVQCKLDGEGGSRFFPGNFTATSSGQSLIFGGTYIAAA